MMEIFSDPELRRYIANCFKNCHFNKFYSRYFLNVLPMCVASLCSDSYKCDSGLQTARCLTAVKPKGDHQCPVYKLVCSKGAYFFLFKDIIEVT